MKKTNQCTLCGTKNELAKIDEHHYICYECTLKSDLLLLDFYSEARICDICNVVLDKDYQGEINLCYTCCLKIDNIEESDFSNDGKIIAI